MVGRPDATFRNYTVERNDDGPWQFYADDSYL